MNGFSEMTAGVTNSMLWISETLMNANRHISLYVIHSWSPYSKTSPFLDPFLQLPSFFRLLVQG